MPNISNFTNRISNALLETIEDRIKLVEQAFCNAPPARLFAENGNSMESSEQSQRVLREIRAALRHEKNCSSAR